MAQRVFYDADSKKEVVDLTGIKNAQSIREAFFPSGTFLEVIDVPDGHTYSTVSGQLEIRPIENILGETEEEKGDKVREAGVRIKDKLRLTDTDLDDLRLVLLRTK